MRVYEAFVFAAFWAVSVSAQTLSSSIAGQVVDARTGAPVKGATVSGTGPFTLAVIGPHDHPAMPPAIRVDAGDRGVFSFSGLSAGSYLLTPRADGYYPFRGDGTLVAPDLTPIGEGEQIKGVVLRMERLGTIAGKVTDEKGAPLQNARIAVYRYLWGNWTPPASIGETGEAFLYTNDRGEYRAFGLVPGPLFVSASYPYREALAEAAAAPGMGHPTRYFGGAFTPAKATAVMVESGQVARADIQLTRSAAYRITGYLTDSNGALPARACVGIAPAGSLPSTHLLLGSVSTPAEGGAFAMDAIPPGEYMLAATNCEGGPANSRLGFRQIEVNGNMDGAAIRLQPVSRVTGMVSSEGCGNLSGFQLFLYSLPPSVGGARGQKVAENGAVAFDNVRTLPFQVQFRELPPGCFVKSAQYGGQDLPWLGIEPRAGAALQVVVSNRDGARLTGTVTGAAGRPVKHPLVTAIPSDGGPLAASQYEMGDTEGAFEFKALRPGEYKVAAWAENPGTIYLETVDYRLLRLHDARARVVKAAPGSQQSVRLTLITLDEMHQAMAKP